MIGTFSSGKFSRSFIYHGSTYMYHGISFPLLLPYDSFFTLLQTYLMYVSTVFSRNDDILNSDFSDKTISFFKNQSLLAKYLTILNVLQLRKRFCVWVTRRRRLWTEIGRKLLKSVYIIISFTCKN